MGRLKMSVVCLGVVLVVVVSLAGCTKHPDIVGSWSTDQFSTSFQANGDITQDIMRGSSSFTYTGNYKWLSADRIRITMKSDEAIFSGDYRVRLLGDTLILYSANGGQIALNPD